MIQELRQYTHYLDKAIDFCNDTICYVDIFLDMSYAGIKGAPSTETRNTRLALMNVIKFQKSIIAGLIDIRNEVYEEDRKPTEPRYFVTKEDGSLAEVDEDTYTAAFDDEVARNKNIHVTTGVIPDDVLEELNPANIEPPEDY